MLATATVTAEPLAVGQPWSACELVSGAFWQSEIAARHNRRRLSYAVGPCSAGTC
ncbi:MAG: hypothetical protein R2712_01975 [Vicinamibacterales bacterium]